MKQLKLNKGHAVAFDFDGVIHKYSKGWQDGSIYDEPNMHVVSLINHLMANGIPVIILSTRQRGQICTWWNARYEKQEFCVPALFIKDDEEFFKATEYIGVTNKKLPAQLYIDDRAFRYTGQTLNELLNQLIMEVPNA